MAEQMALVNTCFEGEMRTKNYPNEYIFRYSDEQKAQIEDFRYSNRIPTASKAFRRLLELGLAAARVEKEKAA
jgi:hypothetical protein